MPLREVLHRHLRLPRQPGRLAAHRGRSARARRRRSRVRATPISWSSTPARSPRAPIRARGRRSGASRATIPSARVVVTGCYATRRPDEVAALPNVVRVVSNDDKDCARRRRPRSASADGDGACGAPIEPGVAGRTAFTLRVQTGCEERCSYCIIPTTRGAGRSLPVERVARRGRAGGARGLQGDRAHRRPPGFVRPRPRRRRARSWRCCGALDSSRRRRHVPDQLARADGLHARRSSTSSPRAAAGSRRTSTCRCSTRAIACSR